MVANDNCSACEFQNGLASSRRYDENRLERNRKPLGRRVQHSNGWRGGSEPNLFKHVGLEAREIPAVGEVFSLDFPLYRTSSPPLKKGEDSYEAWFGFNQSTFGGFLFHRWALLRRISAGFTSGLPGPRSCDKRTIHQNLRLISPFSRTEPYGASAIIKGRVVWGLVAGTKIRKVCAWASGKANLAIDIGNLGNRRWPPYRAKAVESNTVPKPATKARQSEEGGD